MRATAVEGSNKVMNSGLIGGLIGFSGIFVQVFKRRFIEQLANGLFNIKIL